MKHPIQFKTRFKLALFMIFVLVSTTNISAAARVSIGIGTSYGPNVVYIPAHWYHGYWIPGQYVEYAGPAPDGGYIWYQGGFDGGHRWRSGHWGHSHHHH